MTNEELVIRIQAGETELMLTLWNQAEMFTKKQAWRFYTLFKERCDEYGVSAEDLFQEAYLAIDTAVKRFNPEKGVKFLSYAGFYLIKSFNLAVKLHSKALKKYIKISLDTTSAYNENGEELYFSDLLADPNAEAEFDDVLERDFVSQYMPSLRYALKNLSDVQRETVTACHGHDMYYTEYARQRGVKPPTVRQTSQRALNNMRRSMSVVHAQ